MHDALLQAVLEHPDHDAPRLAYADWLDRQGQAGRAEFIRVQCELAQTSPDDLRRRALEAREGRLLSEHEAEWVRPLLDLLPADESERTSLRNGGWSDALVDEWLLDRRNLIFRRGFVESVCVEAVEFLARAEGLIRLAPLRHVEFGRFQWRDTGQLLERLAASPHLARLDAVSLSFANYNVHDDDLRTLAGLPPLVERLQAVHVHECNLTPPGLRVLLMAAALARLQDLTLYVVSGLVGREGVGPVVGSPRLGSLTGLGFPGCPLGDDGVGSLVASSNCDRLTTLGLDTCGCTQAGAAALANSPHLRRLQVLSLSDNALGDEGTRALAGSPGLRDLRLLDLEENAIGDEGAAALARSPILTGVESLHLRGNAIGDAGAEALATSPHFGRLQLLALWDNPGITEAGRAKLQERLGNRVAV